MPSAASHPLACKTQADTCLLYESESPSLLQPSVVQELFASIPIYHSDTGRYSQYSTTFLCFASTVLGPPLSKI